MNTPRNSIHANSRRSGLLAVAAVALTSGALRPAHAFQLDTGVPGVRAVWDTTLKYSNAFRTEGRSQAIVGGPNYDPTSPLYFPNTDDGSNNFDRGLISNRFDLFTEFDLTYRNFGARVSGAAWYDTVYNRGNDNNSPATINQVSVPYNEFTSATRKLHGRKAELLDAFVFGKFDLGSSTLSARLGKHTVLYGESLFFGANGIAAAQAPIDAVKALSVPNAQFKEFMMPISQLSAQLQVSPEVMVGAYYQFDWKADRLPGVGSYFSFVDMLGAGQERFAVQTPGGPASFYAEPERHPKSSGQGGAQVRFRVGEIDYGVYAVRWNARGPSNMYLHFGPPTVTPAGLQIGTFQWVYHEGIKAYGASASTSVGNTNFAAEVSLRTNTPLDSDTQPDPFHTDQGNPLYAVGRSAHAQVSWLSSLGDSFISREADFIGELAFNRLLSVTRNPGALTPDTTRDAANLRMVFEPKYRQVIDGVDLSVPVGVGVGLIGNSAVVGAFAAKNTGDMTLGVNGSYLDVWRFGLNFTHYFGKAGPFVYANHHVFNQSYADRDYVSFNIRRTF